MAHGDKPLRVLELYSGIGGMHQALTAIGQHFEIVAAIDINTTANAIYKSNFPDVNHLQRNIQSLSSDELDSMDVGLLTMSPPCQPFTRQGLKQDCVDPRTSSFLHLLEILPTAKRKPKCILLENVKGFEESETCGKFLDTLKKCGYHAHQYLLSPSQFGVPNSRLRFYCLAKLLPLKFSQCDNMQNCESICQDATTILNNLQIDVKPEITPISHYLEQLSEDENVKYLLSDKVLQKFALILDIVFPESTHSCCFTKGYGHYVEGTGSVLLQKPKEAMDSVYKEITSKPHDDPQRLQLLQTLKLRYFTPKEISRLMCFEETFTFPENISVRQKYQTLGNSINVYVVSLLLRMLLKTR